MIFEVVGSNMEDLKSKIDTYVKILGEPKNISYYDKENNNTKHPKRAVLEYNNDNKDRKVN